VGAAIQGGVLTGEVKDMLLLDVTPLSLGIETMGGVYDVVIEANSSIPTKKTKTYSTAADNQPSVEIHVLQGERPMARDNRTVGRFILDGIPPAPRGVPMIEVTFDIDASGILSVSAKDKGTGKEQKVRIEASTGLTEAEIARMRAEAAQHADEDKKARERVDKLNTADSMVFQTEKQLKEYGDKIPADKRAAIESALNQLRDAHKSEDLDGIDRALETLNSAWQAASQDMYQATSAGGPEGPAGDGPNGATGGSSSSSKSSEDVTDVEFEEVK
jgi:molecular chaperone DnaK